MGKRCDCALAYKNNPDKTFEELIKMGLICETCTSNYYEFCELIKNEPDDKQKTIKNILP